MRRIVPFIAVLLASLSMAATASAGLAEDVLKDYIPDQRLNVCAYTQDQLKKIKNSVPLDQNAYTPDFIAAIDDAIARRAEGACNKKKAAAAAPAAAPVAPAAPPPPPASPGKSAGPAQVAAPAAVQPPPTPAADPTPAPGIVTDAIPQAAHITDVGGSAPFPIVALAILGGLFALAGLLVGLARWFAWEPLWFVRVRHATGEAGWRASSTWAEFTDFVRFGR
jgi:hypothetical protein